MRDAEGRSWKNGTEPMNPSTELPTFKRGIAKAQQDYAAYADATNRASLAKNDHDWQRISDNDYYTIRSQMFNAGSTFERTRSELNQMASTVASTYNKKIDIDTNRHWPDPLQPEALIGLAGEFVRLVDPHTEADPAAFYKSIFYILF